VRCLVALALLAAASVGTHHDAAAQPRALLPSEIDAFVGDEPPEVVLLTFGVGSRIFEKFGHAALCLRYPAAPHRDRTREPLCFNYGVTDFDEGPTMIWSFLRSVQRFWVDPEAWSDLIRFYRAADRDIYEQVLPLSPVQARRLERELLDSLEEANRYYHYDHFRDNCTTRLRDMIDRTVGGALRTGAGAPYPLTYREIGYRGLAGLPPLVALADFVLGRRLDDTPSIWQAMFHPDVLRQRVASSLGAEPRLIYKRQAEPFPVAGPTWRLQMFAIALAFALPLLVATWRRRYTRLGVAWATAYLALWGVAIWALAIVSSIPGVRWNENLFVFVPLDLALPFLSADGRRRYARVRVAGLLLVSALAAAGVFRQPLWTPLLCALLPLAIIAFDQKIASRRR
jgi:hypothetical protein